MKTYLLDIIPKLKRFSQKLDDLSMLTNQHWVLVDEIINSKTVCIFRTNNDLLISNNGKVEKAKWEYLGNNSLLIDKKDGIYLFIHGFLDENILALKVDSTNEYALLVNENKYDGELNSINKIAEFLNEKYLNPFDIGKFNQINKISGNIEQVISKSRKITGLDTDKGKLEIHSSLEEGYRHGDLVYLNGKQAPDGDYKHGRPSWFNYIIVKEGKIKRL